MRVVFVHGACVKDGSWWWHRTAELLAERNVASEAPALPSCGEMGDPVGARGPGLVEDVAAWHARAKEVAARFDVEVGVPQDQPWAMRDFTLFDPSGALWRIAQNLPGRVQDG